MNLDGLKGGNDSPDSPLQVRFNREDIEAFAIKHWKDSPEASRWNGRQIKNAFQTAISLAEWDHFQQTDGNPRPEGPLLTRDHFKIVAKASSHFDNYLVHVRGTDQTRAKATESRRDDIGAEEGRLAAKASKARAARKKKKVRVASTEASDNSEEGSEAEGERSAKKASKSRESRKKKKVRVFSEASDDSEEGSEAEEDSSASGSESESEEEEPPPKKKKKKKSVKKSRKE